MIYRQEDKKEIVFLTGGGTGGHLYPLFSIGNFLVEKGYIVYFLGKSNVSNIKSQDFLIENINLQIYPLKNFSSIFKYVKSFSYARELIKKFNPKFIISAGAYFSIPVSLAGIFEKIPLFLLEQNAIAGKSVRFLSKYAKLVFVNFKNTKGINKDKVVVCKNPIRKQFFDININKAYKFFGFNKNIFTIFVFGASQGSDTINKVFLSILNTLTIKPVQIIHITGPKLYDKVKIILKDIKFFEGINYKFFPYLSHIEYAYSISDLVISRSGATTLTELDFFKKDAILIPFPYATDNHQYYNAKIYKQEHKNNYINIIEEKNLNRNILLNSITNFYLNKFSLSRKLENFFEINKQDAKKVFLCIYNNIIKRI